MSDSDSKYRQCQAISATGKRCERLIGSQQSLCFSHDPAKAKARSEQASKAARAKHADANAEILEARVEIKAMWDKLLERKLPPGVASVAAQLAGVYLRTFDQERKQREFDQLEQRLAEVEKMHQRKLDTPTSASPFDAGGGWTR